MHNYVKYTVKETLLRKNIRLFIDDDFLRGLSELLRI